MRRLARLLSSLVLALALFQAMAPYVPGLEVPCVETCPDDDDGGACPPLCDCACRMPHRVPPVALPATLEPPEPGTVHAVHTVEPPASPDPRGPQHVPIELRA